jgi:hypothetical protein
MRPCISVVIPNFDLKTGLFTQNVLKWTKAKNVDIDRFQIVVVTPRMSFVDNQTLTILLREGDEIVEVSDTENDNSMWNAGALKSKHEYLLFVEGHVTPDENFLHNMLNYIEINSGAEAVNTISSNSKESEFELLMDRWFDETLKLRAESHSFTFLTRQCFMLKKSVFERYGPILSNFEQFSTPYLSCKLAENHVMIETVNFSDLIHENENTIYHHHLATRSYIRGYVRAKTQNDIELINMYFGTNPDLAKVDLRLRQLSNRRNPFLFLQIKLGFILRKLKIFGVEFVIMKINIGLRLKFIWMKKVHGLVVVDQYEHELLKGFRGHG